MASATGLRCSALAPATLRPGGSRATLVMPQLLRSCPCTRRRLERRQSGVVVHARSNRSIGGGGGGGGQVGRPSFGPTHLDRVLAAIPYILPFFDAVMYGRYLFHMFPVLRAAMQPLFPAIAAYHSVPFASFAAFFGVYLGIVNNKSMSRFVRFNGMQAALLDILLVLPRLLESVVSPPTAGFGAKIYIYSQSFIWIFICMWVAFGMVTSLLGQYGRIPFVAEAADQQVR